MKMTNDILKKLVRYNKSTGKFFWKERELEMFMSQRSCSVWNNRFANKEAGSKHKSGYVYISILGKKYLAHRLAFLYVRGSFPKEYVDHVNLDKSDNRFNNLRECTMSQNGFNRKRNTFRKHGEEHKGVCLPEGNYRALIKKDGKSFYIGGQIF